jgi:hypothetical protein
MNIGSIGSSSIGAVSSIRPRGEELKEGAPDERVESETGRQEPGENADTATATGALMGPSSSGSGTGRLLNVMA